MAIDGVNFGKTLNDINFRGSQTPETAKLDQQDFLMLMVAQLQNQNPMDPQDGTEFFNQMAQFDSLSTMREIATAIQSLASFSELANASSLVGREVIAVIPAGTDMGFGPSLEAEQIRGRVDRITFDAGSPFVYIGDRIVRPAFIRQVA